jgi:hypothetical protein
MHLPCFEKFTVHGAIEVVQYLSCRMVVSTSTVCSRIFASILMVFYIRVLALKRFTQLHILVLEIIKSG